MDGFGFDHAGMLHLLWATPVLGGVYLWGFARKQWAMDRFATLNLQAALTPTVSRGRQWAKAALLIAAAGTLVMAMAGPRWGTYYEEVPSRGIDVVFVLDASNSMLAEDVAANRLERAKVDIKDMLGVLSGDRVGLVTFAGRSTVACPLTMNYGWFRLALDAVDTRGTSRGGTNIGDAVRHAGDCFADEVKDHKAIVVISDGGETEESFAIEASRKVFAEKGVRVFTVGLGDMDKGGRIPVIEDGKRAYMRHQGQEVWTKLDPTLLQSMASVADGGYFSNVDFRVIYDRLRRRVAPGELESTQREVKHVQFPWFAGLALVLLTIETLVTDRRTAATSCGLW
jgi:Ca-activated chloride channel family protein